jgi:CRP/FNR family nitrogen fixation transcriptional regulator
MPTTLSTQDESFCASQHGLPAAGPVLKFAANRTVYFEGDAASALFMVVSGVVRSLRRISLGRRQIAAFHAPGDLFGFEFGSVHTQSAEAVSGAVLIMYRRHRIEQFAVQNDTISRQLLACALWSLTRSQDHAVLLGRRTASERVAAFLIDWAIDEAEPNVVTLPMPRVDIADYLGLTVETVSRTLRTLQDRRLIELRSARCLWLKSPAGLQALVG